MSVHCQCSPYPIPVPASTRAYDQPNFMPIGVPLTGLITLDAVNIFSWDRPDPSLLPLKVGDIVVKTAEDIPRLGSAMLEAETYRQQHDDNKFARSILDITGGEYIGYLLVDRPNPDPDTRFQSLVDNTHRAGIQQGLRAIVEPENLIPSPTKGCTSNECMFIIPVSTTDSFSSY